MAKLAARVVIDHKRPEGRAAAHSSKGRLSPVRPPASLVSDWDEPIWQFDLGRAASATRISWNRKLHDGTRLTEPANAELLETAKRYLVVMARGYAGMAKVAVTTAIQRTYTLLFLADALLSSGSDRFSEVTFSQWQDFQESLIIKHHKEKTTKSSFVTEGRVLEIFRAAWTLHEIYNRRTPDDLPWLPDGLAFPPFDRFEDAVSASKSIGRPGGQAQAEEAMNDRRSLMMNSA